MDLTKQFPRSPRETIHGVAMAARTTDKARADAAGTVGEYHYNCGMDQQVFALLGTDPAAFQAAATADTTDEAVSRLIERHLAGKSPAAVEAHNSGLLNSAPAPGSEGAQWFEQSREAAAPGRTDITTWADLLDVEEGREVPRRATAAA